jgi:DNA-binding response OmpR family regulator
MIAHLASPARDSAGPLKSSPPQRILVAEDDEDIRRLNTEVLIHHGYRVDAAEDGVVAWDALQVSPYDLLITDNLMPRVTGVELIKKMRSARLLLPVIMASGTPLDPEFARRGWLQPAAVVRKPYTPDELLGAVRQVLHAPGTPSTWGGRMPDCPSV